MKQLLAFLVLFCFAINTFADDCNNPLLSTFKFDKLNTPTAVSGLKYCKTLKSGKSCCSADTVNTIQEKTSSLGTKISNYVAARDKQVVDDRDKVLPDLKEAFKAFKDSYKDVAAQLDSMSAGKDATTKALMDGMKEMMKAMIKTIDDTYDNMSSLKGRFKTFQKSRTTCMVEILKLQASAYCLACDPAYATKGVTANAVSLSDKACKRIQSACFTYITESAMQNSLLNLKDMASSLDSITASMMSGQMGSIGSASVASSGLSTEKQLAVQTASAPANCHSDTSCDWLCSSMFKNGQIGETTAVLGGDSTTTSTRLLEEIDSTVERKLQEQRRRLAGTSWDPEQDEAGVEVTFSDDPGNVGNDPEPTSGAVLKVGLMCVASMIVAVMF